MGHKVHPNGFRLGIIRDWQARWFAAKPAQYRSLLQEDIQIRDFILRRHRDAAISRVEIERGSQDVRATIHGGRPGVIIGRGGQRVEELRQRLEALTGKRVRVDIQEVQQPELEATLVAQSVADQISRRIAFRRAIRQTLSRSMQAGAQGIKIMVSGRLGGADIARTEKGMAGRVPLHTLRADIDYGFAEAPTAMGRIGVKVWIYRGDILPEPKAPEIEGMEPIEMTISPTPSPSPTAAQETENAPAETS